MTLLVTGAAGFVGLNLVEAALARGERVVAVSREAIPAAARTAFATLPGHLHEARGDVLDADFIEAQFSAHRPDRVVPAAALTPGPLEERPRSRETLSVNILGVLNLLEAAARHGVRRLVYPSSGAVYGANAFAPGALDEVSTAPAPESVYAISKLAAEKLALRWRAVAGLDVVAARLGTVFGPWERDTGQRETLSPHWQILRLAARSTEIVLPGPGRRDWIYARDVAAGLLALLDRSGGEPPVVNLSTGAEWTMADWCAAFAARQPGFRWRVTGNPAEANVDFWSSRDRSPLAAGRLKNEIGFHPRFDLAAAMDDLLAWQSANPGYGVS